MHTDKRKHGCCTHLKLLQGNWAFQCLQPPIFLFLRTERTEEQRRRENWENRRTERLGEQKNRENRRTERMGEQREQGGRENWENREDRRTERTGELREQENRENRAERTERRWEHRTKRTGRTLRTKENIIFGFYCIFVTAYMVHYPIAGQSRKRVIWLVNSIATVQNWQNWSFFFFNGWKKWEQ